MNIKRLLNIAVLSISVLFTLHASAQDNAPEFVPDAKAKPVPMAEANGVKATCILGTVSGARAFSIEFTNGDTATRIVRWRMTYKGQHFSPRPNEPKLEFKLRPGKVLNADNCKEDARLTYKMQPGDSISDYILEMRARLADVPTAK